MGNKIALILMGAEKDGAPAATQCQKAAATSRPLMSNVSAQMLTVCSRGDIVDRPSDFSKCV